MHFSYLVKLLLFVFIFKASQLSHIRDQELQAYCDAETVQKFETHWFTDISNCIFIIYSFY